MSRRRAEPPRSQNLPNEDGSSTRRRGGRPWLFAELDAVAPDVVALMGATAANSLLGNDFRLTRHRGEVLHLPDDDGGRDPRLVVTAHPSSVLRGSPERRDEAFDALVDDLRFAARVLRGQP